MKKIFMKVHGYIEESGSLLLSFSSDDEGRNLDAATVLAYQPASMFTDIADVQEIKKRLATIGAHTLAHERKVNLLNSDEQRNAAFKEMINTTLEFDLVDDLGIQPDQLEN